MKILGLPIGNMNTASSRIRCYRFLKFMDSSFQCSIGDEHTNGEFEVIYLQKRAYRQTIDFAKRHKENGSKIIYDIDDDFGCWENMFEQEMCDLADIVITDTEDRKKLLESQTKTRIAIVPDGIDYIDNKLPSRVMSDKVNSVFTFGSDNGARMAAPIFDRIKSCSKTYYCMRPTLRDATFSKWNLATFASNISKHDLAILVHDGKGSGIRKSNNRLIVCMSMGIPAIVSNTPAYSVTMREVGFEKLIMTDEDKIEEQIQSISAEDIKEISSRFMQFSWERFSPQKSSEKFAETIRSMYA